MVNGDHDGSNWTDAIRSELERYREERGKDMVTLQEIYEFSERQLSLQFPDNNNVRAKIRQQLQRLRDDGDVEFLDDRGTYRITIEE